jgi:hypothetical protein
VRETCALPVCLSALPACGALPPAAGRMVCAVCGSAKFDGREGGAELWEAHACLRGLVCEVCLSGWEQGASLALSRRSLRGRGGGAGKAEPARRSRAGKMSLARSARSWSVSLRSLAVLTCSLRSLWSASLRSGVVLLCSLRSLGFASLTSQRVTPGGDPRILFQIGFLAPPRKSG